VVQPVRETYPNEPSHRFPIDDNDSIFSLAVTHAIESPAVEPNERPFEAHGGTERRSASSAAFGLSCSTLWWYSTKST
jgi:hypothetical protein